MSAPKHQHIISRFHVRNFADNGLTFRCDLLSPSKSGAVPVSNAAVRKHAYSIRTPRGRVYDLEHSSALLESVFARAISPGPGAWRLELDELRLLKEYCAFLHTRNPRYLDELSSRYDKLEAQAQDILSGEELSAEDRKALFSQFLRDQLGIANDLVSTMDRANFARIVLPHVFESRMGCFRALRHCIIDSLEWPLILSDSGAVSMTVEKPSDALIEDIYEVLMPISPTKALLLTTRPVPEYAEVSAQGAHGLNSLTASVNSGQLFCFPAESHIQALIASVVEPSDTNVTDRLVEARSMHVHSPDALAEYPGEGLGALARALSARAGLYFKAIVHDHCCEMLSYRGRLSDHALGPGVIEIHDAHGVHTLANVDEHLRDAFAWGYSGGGPTRLAASILADVELRAGKETSGYKPSPLVHDFRDFFLEGQYMDAGFELNICAILDWASRRHAAWYKAVEAGLRGSENPSSPSGETDH